MTIYAFPFDDVDVSETNFSRFFRELQDSGVATDALGGTGFQVTASGSNMTLTVAPGVAILRGFCIVSDANVTVSVAAAATSQRFDRVILRLDPSNNSITPLAVTGTAGSTSPQPLQDTDTGIADLPLALVTVPANATALSSSNVEDDRRFVGGRVGVWLSDRQRPSNPRFGRMGYNISANKWEWWNGVVWSQIATAVSWAEISDKPTTLPPAAHSHSWADIPDKPATYTPATHTHSWDAITGKPTSFTPSTHTHNYAATSHTHNYAAVSHTHAGSNITSAVNRANGSDRPHSETPEGSGWYAVWVDGNHNFCRNTSSIRYKTNVRDHAINPEKVLALRPRLYDRIGDGTPKGEYGLIAEEVNATLPEIVVLHNGEIDSVRYDLLGVALLNVVKHQAAQIAELTQRIEALETP